MLHSYFIKRALTLLLAVSVVFAPLAPALATGAGSDGARAAHVSHGGDHDAGGPVQADQPSKPCTAHAACTGPCCAGCANCFGAVSLVQPQPHLEFLKAFVMRMVPENDSLLLITESDVPPGSGLGGSGALGVAIVAAIDRAYGRARSSEETAALANDIERNDLGYPGGDQDSYGAAFGGINLLEYRTGGGMNRRRLSITRDTQRALEFRR